jgi:hypothetical protein
MAYPITAIEIAKDEGSVVEILLNHRLSEKDLDEARLLAFFDTSCYLIAN